ncbi:hypothetical protein HGRIS_005086 [Hohenbuehelia grisea]|uniref:Uncharacterized protein n=1 Tax=Hohenbuehelia grisea TaxID=104357 RepID=A0ABR3JFK0_9AGAR
MFSNYLVILAVAFVGQSVAVLLPPGANCNVKDKTNICAKDTTCCENPHMKQTQCLYQCITRDAKEGETCASYPAPGMVFPKCAPGLECRSQPQIADLATCEKPVKIAKKGESCGGFGPIGTVFPQCEKGLKCCTKPMVPDLATCETECKPRRPPPVGEGEICGGYPLPNTIYPECKSGLKCCTEPLIADRMRCFKKCPTERILAHGQLCM